MQSDKNSAKQLIRSSVWLGEDLRDHETLSGGELGLLCRCLCHFVQLLDVELSSPATAHWVFCRHPQQPLQSFF